MALRTLIDRLTHARGGMVTLPFAAAFALVGALLLAAPASDSAASTCATPVVKKHLTEEKIWSTRAYLVGSIEPDGCNVEAKAEYAESPSGPWTLVNTESFEATGGANDSNTFSIGQYGFSGGENATSRLLHHLSPSRQYFARFSARNAEAAEASETFAFTTAAAAKPEVARGVSEEANKQIEPRTLFRVMTDVGGSTSTSQAFTADLESNGLASEYHFEYAEASGGAWKPFASGGSGSISVAEDFAEPEARATGLMPETTYRARVRIANADGTVEQAKFLDSNVRVGEEYGTFTTRTARPVLPESSDELAVTNVTGTTAHLTDEFGPNGSESTWQFESAPSASGPWTPVAGSGGTVSLAEAQALGEMGSKSVEGELTGLAPASEVFVRLSAQNAAGPGQACQSGGFECKPPIPSSFTTSGPPVATTLSTHALHGEAVRLLGFVNPESTLTSAEQRITVGGSSTGGSFTLTYKGQTVRLPFDATSDEVGEALEGLPGLGRGSVMPLGEPGGPYVVRFRDAAGEVAQPLLEADASGLTPSGSVSVITTQAGGEGYDAHYHFQYVTQEQFEKPGGEGGFADAAVTPEVDLGSGSTALAVGQDLPALKAGETYHYRIVATSTLPGNPVVTGEDRTLVAPTPVAVSGEPSSCPNEASRTGPSATLPNCRAYEQLTPLNKEGAAEAFAYGAGIARGALASLDGDRVVYEDGGTVDWQPTVGHGPFFFSREEGVGWSTLAAAPLLETGVEHLQMDLYEPADMSQVALQSEYQTSSGAGESPDVKFKVGPPGGPYATVASVPRSEVGEAGSWVAATPDFSKLVLMVEDHRLAGGETGTLHGYDLYEYTGGELRQVNVASNGEALGSCGAHLVTGENAGGNATTPEAISSDGSRVFFEETPGGNCSAPAHLYVREAGEDTEAGERTIDIGAYRFLAASGDGGQVLLERQAGETLEVLLYDTATQTVEPLFSHPAADGDDLQISKDLSAVYFYSHAALAGTEAPSTPEGGSLLKVYRYDLASRSLVFVAQALVPGSAQISPDGRFYYFQAQEVAGVPGQSPYGHQYSERVQVYRYDSASALIECVSCASPFDPAPRLAAYLGAAEGGIEGRIISHNQALVSTEVSGNGDYAFFFTASALVPGDVDGEIEPGLHIGVPGQINERGYESFTYSPSTDVYEWRKDGIDGCGQLQGCLALITTGHGGVLNFLIGSADEGRDVFFTSESRLLPEDQDNTENIFDARIDGGLPAPAPRPVECEGDACSTPASAPNDSTPASLTFAGLGNLPPLTTPAPSTKAKAKTKKKLVKKKSKKKRKGRKSSKQVKQTDRRRGK